MKHVFIINPMAGPQDSHLLVEEEEKILELRLKDIHSR